MSENKEKSVAEKTVKTEKKKEKKRRRNRFGEMVSELKKVSWPTKADLRTYAACVLLFVVVCSALLAVMDIGVTELIKVITKSEGGLPELLNSWFNI